MKEKARRHNSRVSPGVRTSTRGQKCTRNAQKQPSPCAQGDAIARGTGWGSHGGRFWPGTVSSCAPCGRRALAWVTRLLSLVAKGYIHQLLGEAGPPALGFLREKPRCLRIYSFIPLVPWGVQGPQVSLRLPVLLVLTSQLKFLVLLRHLKDGEETKGWQVAFVCHTLK